MPTSAAGAPPSRTTMHRAVRWQLGKTASKPPHISLSTPTPGQAKKDRRRWTADGRKPIYCQIQVSPHPPKKTPRGAKDSWSGGPREVLGQDILCLGNEPGHCSRESSKDYLGLSCRNPEGRPHNSTLLKMNPGESCPPAK